MNVRLGNLVSCSFKCCSCFSSIHSLTHAPLNTLQHRRPNHCIIKDNQCNFAAFDFSSDVWVWICSCSKSSVSSSHALNSIEFGQFCHLRRGFGCPIVNLFCLSILGLEQGFVINVDLTPSCGCCCSPAFTSASPKLTCNNFSPQVKTLLNPFVLDLPS